MVSKLDLKTLRSFQADNQMKKISVKEKRLNESVERDIQVVLVFGEQLDYTSLRAKRVQEHIVASGCAALSQNMKGND